ncbi:putative response regulatory protein [Paenibacillus konkukensis]|uniref:Response regulatory protein n=1 Tax=Paenibacillus konkukensis TaxID=2020716 RepID=A0ABY4RMC5_9BACL|nr:response regulator [Paenibacillus konkukensis]UQZ83637.1 putative response regulatory protein [Paenibacillus konkukensis]
MYHVLVVEDELLIRDALVEMVHQLDGFKVTGEAASCEEGWRLMQELWPTVVITDIQLPDQDGLELIHRIRNQRLPVVTIIISGHDRFSYAQNAIRLHVSEYLLKPISEVELHSALSRSVGRLETCIEPNQILRDIQRFIDRLHEFEPIGLFEQTDRILHAILGGRSLDQGSQTSYLRIFMGKLTEYIKIIHPEFQDASLPEDLNEQRVRHVFHDLLHEWTLRYPQFAGNNMRLVIKRACEYMGAHMQDELTLKQMADYSNLSPSYFGVLFKQYTGKSFVNYLNYIRIEKAMELLRTSDKKVYEIAEDVGFATLPYFNRVFKHVALVTPNEYRKGLGL